MQSVGQVKFKEEQKVYTVIWTNFDLTLERIEVVENLSQYNVIDTSSCIAAYFDKTRPLAYGDVGIIKRILSTKHTAITAKPKVEEKVEFVKEGLQVTLSKVDESIGVSYKQIMLNGSMTYAYYETPDAYLEFTNIDVSGGNSIQPINLNNYEALMSLTTTGLDRRVSTGNAEYYSLDYLRAIYDIAHIDSCDYVVAQSYEEAKSRLDRWIHADTPFKSIDVESTGLEMTMFGPDCLTGVLLSYSTEESTYFPFRQETWDYNLPFEFLQELVDAVNNQPKEVKIVGYNAKVEIEAIMKEAPFYIKYSEYACNFPGYEEGQGLKRFHLRIDVDAYLLSTLVDPIMQKGLHSLKHRAEEAVGLFFLELKHIFKGPIKFNKLPPEIVRVYACPDTANTIRAYEYLLKKLPKDEMGIFELENKLLNVIVQHEFYGMKTQKERLAKLIENEQYKVEMLSSLFKGIHSLTSNINSPATKSLVFYQKLRCPVLVHTKSGSPSTSKIALKQILKSGAIRDPDLTKCPANIVDKNGSVIIKGEDLKKNRYPSLLILDKYNKATKELGALRRIERKSRKDRVMFNINQTGAGSGRQTSDAHQYSDVMKSLIISDSRYHNFWSADFKQIELRILAYEAGQKDLIEMECDKNVDVHRAILSIIMGKPMWAISAEERKNGKAVNFGVVYMMSKYGLASSKVGPAYTEEDLLWAEKSIIDFYNGLPNVKALVAHNEEFIRKNGYIRTPMGRYRYFPKILDPAVSESVKRSYVRAGNNTPVQGFGADYLKLVECTVQDYIHDKGWDELVECDGVMLPLVRIMLTIHDELLVSTHKSIPHEDIITMFKVCMEQKIKGAPPFFSGPALVGSWSDGKLDAYEIPLDFRDEIVDSWEQGRGGLLHNDTYLEGYDWKFIVKLKDDLAAFRKKFLTDRDMQRDGAMRLVISERTMQQCIKSLDEETKQLYIKHALSDTEQQRAKEPLRLAISRCLDEDFSPYLNDLNNYRTKMLSTYMNGLIAKWKTTEAVAEHVRDDNLTHVLISKFEKETKGLDHMSAIAKATQCYMELDEESLGVVTSIMPERIEAVEEVISTYEDFEKYVDVTADGELIMDETEEEDDDLENIVDFDAVRTDEALKQEYCVYCLDYVLVDVSDFDVEVAQQINNEIAKLHKEDGYYKVKYLVKGSNALLQSNVKLDYIPDKINALVKRYEEGVVAV